jgi:polyphosphate kinase 2
MPPGTGDVMKRKSYEAELKKLQTELVAVQDWVQATGQRIVIIFEGRDAAGKGGVIKAITERVSPRVFRVIALPAPNDREKTQMYAQRYLARLPAGGEVVIFDRSWYNRAGVERVMGFATGVEVQYFLDLTPFVERHIQLDGIVLLKYWLEVSDEEQEKRFRSRIEDAHKQWKLSPMDLEARRQWYAYSRARDAMLDATDTPESPWHIVDNNDKYRGRLNCIRHLLDQLPYETFERPSVELPGRDESDAYDDVASMSGRRYVPEHY